MWTQIKQHLQTYRNRYLGIFGVVIAAICANQIDVPVKQTPVIQMVSNTQANLVEDFASTTTTHIVYIRQGFVFDGASEPRISWTALGLTPFSGVSLRAALTHDALYSSELVTRDEADLIFKEILIYDGCQLDKAEAMYQAVHLAGGVVWAKHTTESVNQARQYVTVETR